MKLLLFSDLHADAGAAQSIAERADDFDLLVGAGDFGNQRRQLDVCLPILKTIARPQIYVAGNNESFEELRAACTDAPQIHVLHGAGIQIGGVTFWGVGGGVPPTPFGEWSFDLSESQAARLLENCPPNAILISHSPPLGTLDVSSSGMHLGSEAVACCLNEKSPRLLVCGHIHASAGQTAYVGTTEVINAGPQGVEWEI